MAHLEKTLRTINNKLFLIIIVFFGGIGIIIARLYYLQLFLASTLLDQSKRNYTRVQAIHSPRGNIVDCHGELLATNRPLIDVIWEGTGNRTLQEQQKKSLDRVTEILHIDSSGMIDPVMQAERATKSFVIASDISFDELSKLSEVFSADKNIKLKSSFKRFYPYNSFASHLLGYLSQESIEYIGKMGLEQIFEQILKGKQGKIIATINASGKKISQEEIMQAISGQTIQTCLDIDLQRLAEDAFPEDYAGCVIIMDPFDGDIKAMLSRPTFDPNIFLKSISYDEWQKMQKQKPFINRACNALYPPASIFKLISLITGMEEGIINDQSTMYCCGNTVFAGRKYHCANVDGHGHLTLKEAFAKSCNILFFEMAKKIKINTLASYAKKFGLGEKTGIILTEKAGLVPTNEWKLKAIGERWWPGETLSAIIGQSYTLVTPLQLVRMMAAVFTGTLAKPRILMSEEVLRQELGINPHALKFLQQLLNRVTKAGGSAARLNAFQHDMEIYGKTGTAQTSDLSKRDLGKEFMEHAWFVSYFQYKDTRPLAMVVMVENAGKSTLAVEASKKIFIGYRKLMRARE